MCRQYEPIWIALKSLSKEESSKVGVKLTAPRALHRRIIKAVKKEKWMDIGYKIQIEPLVATLEISRSNSILHFTLTFTRIGTYTVNDF